MPSHASTLSSCRVMHSLLDEVQARARPPVFPPSPSPDGRCSIPLPLSLVLSHLAGPALLKLSTFLGTAGTTGRARRLPGSPGSATSSWTSQPARQHLAHSANRLLAASLPSRSPAFRFLSSPLLSSAGLGLTRPFRPQSVLQRSTRPVERQPPGSLRTKALGVRPPPLGPKMQANHLQLIVPRSFPVTDIRSPLCSHFWYARHDLPSFGWRCVP